MKWLDPPGDPVEALLRQALDQAAARTGDEIARRRVWTHIATPAPPPRLRRWVLRAAVGATIAAAATGAILVWPSAETSAPGAGALVAARTPVPASAPPPRAVRPRRALFEGPATVTTKARERAEILLWGGTEADLEPNSMLSVAEDRRTSIEKGRVSLLVPRQQQGRRFSVTAGPYLISVLGTKFHVRVAGDSVGVDVDEGIVEVWRGSRVVRVRGGESWTSPASPEVRAAARRAPVITSAVAPALTSALAAPASAPGARALIGGAPQPMLMPSPVVAVPPAERFRAAQAALAQGQPQRALELLELAARGSGPSAENAAYEIGRVLRDHLLRPRQAIAAWQRYRAQYPGGLLRAEVDLAVLETRLTLGDVAVALEEAESFLQRHPDNERRQEIGQLADRLRSESGTTVSRGEPAGPGVF